MPISFFYSVVASTLIITLLCLVCCVSCKHRTSVSTLPESDDSELALAIFEASGASNVEANSHDPILLFAIWSNGKAIWRKAKDPSSPIYTANINPMVLEQLLERLASSKVVDPEFRDFYVGSGSGYTCIEVAIENKWHKLASWHENYADSPLVVGDAGAIRTLEPGEIKTEQTTDWGNDYREFRHLWDVIREFSEECQKSPSSYYDGEVPTSVLSF